MIENTSISRDHLSMLESFPEATVVLYEDGEIYYANKLVEKLFGYDSDELVGQSIKIILPGKFEESQIEDVKAYLLNKEHITKRRSTALLGKNSSNVEFPVKVSLCPLPPEFDKMLAASIRDVSGNVNTEHELIRKNHLLSFAEEIVLMGHWQWDLKTNDVIWSDNLYKMFGRDEVGGLKYDTYFSYVHPEDMGFVTERVQTSLANKHFHDFTHKILLKNGQVKTIHLVGQIFTDEDDNPIEMVGTCQDVTQQIRNEQILMNVSILEAKSAEMEQFAYIASHDLRHPLLTIINYIKAFDEDFGSALPDDAKGYLSAISQSANRMDKLIMGLLEYARLSQKKKLEVVDCNVVIDNVIKDLSSTVKTEKAKILVDSLPVMNGYEIELHQLFQNIIVNAIKFKKENVDPEIHIVAQELETAGNYLFEIRDNGIGIAEKNLEKIFNIFRRLHENDEFEGYGLGLANCKKIVELHHGKIWAQSEVGVGTSFYFTIKT